MTADGGAQLKRREALRFASFILHTLPGRKVAQEQFQRGRLRTARRLIITARPRYTERLARTREALFTDKLVLTRGTHQI